MKVLFSISFLCLLGFSVSAQNGANSSISGIVSDAIGNKVTGAEITVVSETYPDKIYKGVTNDKGFYSFGVPSGKARIRASKTEEGVTRYSKYADEYLIMDKEKQVDLVLTSEVLVTARVDVKISTGTSQPFSEVSKTVDSLDGQDIRDRNENSVVDALRTLPGFRVQQLGGYGKTASIKTRGLRNQDTAILLDGQRLRDPASITGDASAFISDISTINVERVEVLRGSGSSVYGTNAIGGVIDIHTFKPGAGFHGNVLSEAGGLGFTRFAGDGGYGSPNGKFGFTAGLSRTGFTRGVDGADDANNTSFRGRVEIKPNDRVSFSGRFFASDAFVRLNTNPDTLGAVPTNGIIDGASGVNFSTDRDDPDSFQRSDYVAGQVSAAFIFDPQTVFSASYQGLVTKRENENGGLGPGFQPFGGTQFSHFDGQIHTVNTRLDWTPARTGRFIAGYEYELEKYGNSGEGPGSADTFFTRVDQASNTMFVQYLQSFLERRLQFAGGVRAQTFSLSLPEFSVTNAPYAGLDPSNPPSAYTFDGAASYYIEGAGTKLRAHVGNGYRVPSLYERFGSFYSSFSQDFTALGDPNLEPERSIAFDAGVDKTLVDGRVNLTATYFYTQLTDTIGYGNIVRDIGSTSRPFGGYLNTKGGYSRGVEFAATLRPFGSTGLFASYTFTNSDQLEPQVSGSGVLSSLGIADHRFTLNATQRIAKRVSVNFDFEASSSYLAPIFSSSTFSTFIYRFSGNRRGDLTARYDLPLFDENTKASFFVTVENLFGYSYFENGFATAGRTARAGVGFRF